MHKKNGNPNRPKNDAPQRSHFLTARALAVRDDVRNSRRGCATPRGKCVASARAVQRRNSRACRATGHALDVTEPEPQSRGSRLSTLHFGDATPPSASPLPPTGEAMVSSPPALSHLGAHWRTAHKPQVTPTWTCVFRTLTFSGLLFYAAFSVFVLSVRRLLIGCLLSDRLLWA